MITRIQFSSAACLIALAGAAYGESFDPDPRSGRIFDVADTVVAYGPGDAVVTRRFVPLAIPQASSAFNNTVVRIVNGSPLGAVTTFSSSGNPNVIFYVGTADTFDDNGGYTSNNIVLDEFPNNRSNTLGQMLSDGRIVYRANFAGSDQNNLETILGDVKSQTPAFPEPDMGDEILDGPGTSGQPGTAFLGVPAAIESADGVFVGNTNFDGGTGHVPSGTNIWDYSGAPLPASTPDYTYSQADAEAFATANGVPIGSGDGRQTQPVLAQVNDVYYVVMGINDTGLGGSSRPALLAVDAFEDDNSYGGAVAIVAPTGSLFIDHQATGGGGGPFENKHFDMNSAGQLVVVTETDASVPTYRLWLYNPIFTEDRITGYQDPILIADAGPADVIDDGLGGPIVTDDPGDPIINAIGGVGINDLGNIAFSATYDTGEVDPDTGDPILSSAAYFYNGTDMTLHQVLRDEDLVGGDDQILVGTIAQEGSDSFFATSLADDADVLGINFRANIDDPTNPARGIVMMVVGHEGDADFDGDVDLADLGELLASFDSQFGEPLFNPDVDFNCDGTIDLSDLGTLLAEFGS